MTVACAPAQPGAHAPSAPAQDLRRSAERGEGSPTPESGAAPAPALACGDTVLNDQATSGGEQLTHVVPCQQVEPATTPAPAPLAPAPPAAEEPAKKKGPAIQGPR